MFKVTHIKTFAEEGLEDVQKELPEIEDTTVAAPAAATDEWNEDNLQAVSGGEQIAAYYQLKTPTKVGKTAVLIFQKGVSIKGTYLRTISREAKSRDGRRFTSYTFLVKSKEDNKVYGLSGPGLGGTMKDGSFRGFNKLENGSRVSVTYQGQREGKDGVMYENFVILGDKLKS